LFFCLSGFRLDNFWCTTRGIAAFCRLIVLRSSCWRRRY
jgi:hypothetical protein